ncbi:SDR family NAD(P)-dependent oxidoreductase [Microbacterium trichothecenolyticum]|uniref:NAD(P)-dependent dehydrogenase (Short-subunit alcohol dehydrogenase family) n=1 Tax=Microbacterium trichothecenolyticum TaxID=69370 RepID=A0ABU0TQR7_MICTR|nr:SDR family NAD(P)-dependent oxidoreductase [Microbacterium trichothecenolyticum]MDQ1122016.1 NAD(P)-dependent dehydrogenase (short-subunit alcohol dehydrogenase family) [Microbacterium trichothecenolyticum]
MSFTHHGKVALITGAGSGIGRETALRLAAEGARIAVADISADAADETVALIRAQHGEALPLVFDVRDREAIARGVQIVVDVYGGLDYLVNNAGVVTKHSFETLTEEAWDFVVDVNLKGQFLVSQVAAPVLARSGGGAIVNLSTLEATVVVTSGTTAQPHYNASKGGVPMLTKALAVELAAQGTRVNCVAPGPIATNFFDLDAVTSEEGQAFMNQRLLIKRVGRPADIAAAVSFLLSDDASFITGIQLPVDGGWLTR